MKFFRKQPLRIGPWLPNAVTLCNLFAGFFSILAVTDERFELGAWLIFLAMIFDSLDGNIARALKQSNEFGRELDSLADVVSFVVAPTLLAYKSWPSELAPWGLIVVLLYLSAGTYRLARFNIRPPVRAYFEGFPTPAGAVIIAMTVIAYQKGEWLGIVHRMVDHGILMVAIGFLMVSSVPYPKISGMRFSKWQLLFYVGAIVFSLGFIVINFETAIALLFLSFLIVCPILFHFQKIADAKAERIALEKH